jgi:hypothetical protein
MSTVLWAKEVAMTTNRAEAGPPPREPERTLEEIIRAKHPSGHFTLEEAYAGPSPFESDQEIDEFIRAVRQWRNESLA